MPLWLIWRDLETAHLATEIKVEKNLEYSFSKVHEKTANIVKSVS